MYYQNVIKRKAKCRAVQKRINSTIRKVTNKTLEIIGLDDDFYERLMRNIKLGLQMIGEIQYYKDCDKVGIPSIKAELSDFHLHKNKEFILTSKELDETYNGIVELIESYFYNDKKYEVVQGVDEKYGTYFAIKIK